MSSSNTVKHNSIVGFEDVTSILMMVVYLLLDVINVGYLLIRLYVVLMLLSSLLLD